MAIRVLVISNYRDFHTTRPEAEIFKGLAKYKEFEIFVMTYKDSQHVKDFEALGIKVIHFYPQKKRNKKEIGFIREGIIKNEIDIIHLFTPRAIYSGLRAAKGLDVKVVLYRGYSSNINFFDPFPTFKFLHPRVDKIMCNSIGVEEYLHKFPFFDKTKTVVISKGHEIEWYKNIQPIDIKKELDIPKDTFLLVNVSNNRKMKGIPVLLRAMNELPENCNAHLILVGKNMYNKKNLRIIKNKGKIHFLGFRKDALNVVASSDVFVLSSIFGESITKAVLEAMSLGIAPVISNIRGNYELVVNNQNGLVFKSKNYKELAKNIMFLYENRHLCKEFGEKSKERIKNILNNKQTIEKIKEFYMSLVK